jgi:GNAT superfamily N-acetyltransferase
MTPATAAFEGLRFRPLADADVEAAAALSAEAGWNQTADDWRLMLPGGRTIGVEAPDGRLVATALANVYEDRVAWIAMVLVTKAWQRRGLATELMRRTVAACREVGLVTGLDATPAGREVYRPLGFRDVYRFTRLEATAPRAEAPAGGVRRMESGDLDRAVAYDRAGSGMARPALIESLRRRRPRHAWLAERGGRLTGIALARDGRRAQQIGPVLADDAETVAALARAALAGIDGAAFIDVLDDKAAFRADLEAAGFAAQRGYIRMLLEREAPLDDTARVYAVAGPEFG